MAEPSGPSLRDRWMWEYLLQDQGTPYEVLTILGGARFRALSQDPVFNRLQLLRHLQEQLDRGRFDHEMLTALFGLQALAVRLEGTPAWRPVVPSGELYGRVKIEAVLQHLRKETADWAAFREGLQKLFPASVQDTEEPQWGGLQKAQEELRAVAAELAPPLQEKVVKRYPRAPLVAALRAFLEAAWGVVGPPYLQLVADDISMGRFKLVGGEEAEAPQGLVVTMKELLASFPKDSRRAPEVAPIGGSGLQRSKRRRFSGGEPSQAPAPVGDPTRVDLPVVAEVRREIDEAMPDVPSPEREDAHPSFFIPLIRSAHPAPDPAAVIGDLRKSSQALRKMGHDPLPAVLAQAGVARSTRKATRAVAAAAAMAEGEPEGVHEAGIPEEGERGGEEPSPEVLAQRAAERGKAKMSLMDRQEGARTLEWTEEEDPIESTPEAGARPPRLPSPGAREPPPDKIRRSGEGAPKSLLKSGKPRRPTNPWRPAEEEALLKGVREFGEGKWKRILTEYADVFERRTGVDLKDKWRTRSKDHDFR